MVCNGSVMKKMLLLAPVPVPECFITRYNEQVATQQVKLNIL